MSRKEIEELVALGPLPASDSSDDEAFETHFDALLKIERPVTQSEAVALLSCFGSDDCFGGAWTLLHLIETAPSPAVAEEPDASANGFASFGIAPTADEWKSRGGPVEPRNILHPVDVPWMVSPSVPDIRLTVDENGDALATFDVAVLPVDGDVLGGLPDRRVELLFKAGQWARTAPAFADVDPVPPGLFDWSHVPGGRGDAMDDDVERAFADSRARWVSTGRCPDPGVYQVESSAWLVEVNAARFGCRHYVVVGHDMWFEVLCLGLSWRFCGDASAEAIETDQLEQLADLLKGTTPKTGRS